MEIPLVRSIFKLKHQPFVYRQGADSDSHSVKCMVVQVGGNIGEDVFVETPYEGKVS
jgi:hypothetical protein